MSKSLFNIPTDSDLSAVADFAELQCLKSKSGKLSRQDLERALTKPDDQDSIQGIEDEATGSVSHTTEAAFVELGRREDDCGPGGYPFLLEDDVLVLQSECWVQPLHVQYLFMLIATRNNMGVNDRIANVGGQNIDGTELFEQLSGNVALAYLGHQDGDLRSGMRVVGTSRRAAEKDLKAAAYSAAINDLCAAMGEGGGYVHRADTGKPQDDGLDIAAWRSFSDSRNGKLILFGQCKTGTSWDETDICRLNARSLISMRTVDRVLDVEPLHSFFVTKRIFSLWTKFISYGRLVFDRCRIVDYGETVEGSLIADCAEWSQAVLAREAP